MEFLLGVVAGLAVAILIATVYAIINTPIQGHIAPLIRQNLQSMNGRKGYIFEPEPEEDEARRERIRENAEQGKDTTVEELR